MQLAALESKEELSSEDLDDAIAARGHDQAAVLAPDNTADALTTHNAMCGDFLGADALVEGPEAYGGVVTGRYGFATIFTDGEGGDGGWMGEHVVGALTWEVVSSFDTTDGYDSPEFAS